MTTIEPKVEPAGRYSVQQTRQLLGIARSTLDEWTKRGYIKCHYHHTLRKFYKGIDIIKCWRKEI